MRMNNRMQERRVLKRRHLVVYLDVIDRESQTVIGQLGDISVEGLLVVSREAISSDQTWQLRVVLPDMRGYKGEYLDVDALPCWKSADINPELVCTGFSFIDLDEGDRDKILTLIQLLGFRD